MQLLIEKMACGGCVETVTKAIMAVDPSAKVSADTSKRMVSVDTTADLGRIEKALADVGYPARAA